MIKDTLDYISHCGLEFVTTVGLEQKDGPYELLLSSSGGPGALFQWEGLSYSVPNDGRAYSVMRFRNPDESAFIKVSKYPEGVGVKK